MLQPKVIVRVQKLTEDTWCTELILHGGVVHDLPELSLRPRRLPDWAVADHRITENRHLSLVNMAVHLKASLGQLLFQLFQIYFGAHDVRNRAPQHSLRGFRSGIFIIY
jgi:hypothetical protein